MFVDPIEEHDIETILLTLNKNKTSNDSMFSTKLLQHHAGIFSRPLALFNLSLRSGTMPEPLKIAKVIPIHKTGPRDKASNYRPISLLSNINKVLEKLVHTRMYSFLTKYELLYDHQFGFRPGHSTTLSVIETIDSCYKNLSEGNEVLAIFIDLSKAFDTVNHDILLHKLYHYSIRGQMHNWFKSYLQNRQQFSFVNGVASSYKTVNTGVPQGSILGPLLFLLYTNDLGRITNKIKLFADDTNLFLCSTTRDALESEANNYLSLISKWMIANRLTININKTCYTLLSRQNKNQQQNLFINIDSNIIKQNDYTKYLGIIIDKRLNWEEHINSVIDKISKYIGIFYKIRKLLPIKCLRQLYFTLVHPHILYGVELYANTTSSRIKCLEIINNKILRAILVQDYGTRICNDALYKEMNTLPISKLHRYSILVFVHNCQYHIERVPDIYKTYFVPQSQIHEHNVRNFNSNYHLPRMNLVLGQRSLKYKAVKYWNSLPLTLKSIRSIPPFKTKLREYLFNSDLT